MKKIYNFKLQKIGLVKCYIAFLFFTILVLQVTSAYSQTPLITNVTTTTGRTYTVGQLIAGTTIYTDRTYQATTVPAFLNNAPFIKTANNDKASTATSILSFDLTQGATVYVAYDPRATVLPAWLSSWQKLASQIGVNDSQISFMELYSKTFPAGKVTLDGNLASPAAGAQNMYFVAALAAAQFTLTVSIIGSGTVTKNPNQTTYASGTNVTLTATPSAGQQFTGWSGAASGTVNPLTITMDADKTISANFSQAQTPGLITNITTTTAGSYTLSQLIAGTTIYTDRTYQATTVPAFLNNAPFIKTPNNDKASTAISLFSFDLTQSATVYVVYDPRATALPAWLSSWQKLASQVGVNDSKISLMDLYSKTFPTGKVTLGGNLASPAAGAQNMYFVAALAATQFTLTVTISGSGTVTKNPNQATYAAGSSVTLTATPAAGKVFTGWSGAATGTVNPLTIIMDANKSITASFATATAPAIVVTPLKIYDNDVSGGAAGINRKVTVKNTGSAVLSLSSINTTGTNTNQFVLSGLPAFPKNINAGDSISFFIAFKPTSTGLKTAAININSNAPSPVTTIPIRGLGTPGLGGVNEPSLQSLLNLLEIQVNVGDDNSSTNVIHSNTTSQKAALLGEEGSLQKFQKAGTGKVTITPLAVFGPTTNNPIVAAGWYKSGNVSSKLELFSVSNSPVSNGQTVNVNYTGTLSFDPLTSSFGFYSRWPVFSNRHLYSEDNLNTFSGSIPHHVRVYRNKKNGVFIANSYVVAFEEHIAGFDYQDVLFIVNNVKPATATSQPTASNALSTEDQAPAISANRIVPATIIANENFKIFPNLIHNTFTIEFPEKHQGNTTIQIIDLRGKIYSLGKTILTQERPVVKVDISKLSLNSGMYFLRIVTEGRQTKVIKLMVL